MAKKKKQRLKLQKKTEIPAIIRLAKNLYFSGFCLTDNNKFALFANVEDENLHFLFDKEQKNKLKSFTFTENDLNLVVNKEMVIQPSLGIKYVSFPNVGLVERHIYNWFFENYSELAFYSINEWFGQRANSLIIVTRGKFGKPIGIFKTIEAV